MPPRSGEPSGTAAHCSSPSLLALHGVRVLGSPTSQRIAERFRLDPAEVGEQLLDAQAYGWATRWDAFGETTWSLTDAGRTEDEHRLSDELDVTGTRETVVAAHRAFLALNARHGQVCTRWQLRPTSWDPLSFNDHSDPAWDADVLDELTRLQDELETVCDPLTRALARFDRYAELHGRALGRVQRGDHAWLDAPDRPSCQLVWMQLHEDLLASLGIPRGTDG